MKVEEDVLRNVLREAIADVNNKAKVDKAKELAFNMFNITGGEMVFILNGKTSVDLMQKEMLYKVNSILYALNDRVGGTFDADKLNVDNYFYDNEKLEYGKKINRKSQDEDIVIKSGNWMKVNDYQYIIKVYPDMLLESFIDRNKVNYNPETQRDLTIKETKTGKIRVITIDSDAYEAIFHSMESGDYISDMLALNINPDFYEPPRIIRDNLIIPNNSKIDCIDGYHRLRGAITTKLRNNDWDQPMLFFLFVYDVKKAVQYIVQQDKKIHLSDEQVTKSDKLDAANFIIDKLNDSRDFVLKNSISEDDKVPINKIISKIFNPKRLYKTEDRQDAVKIYKVIEYNINALFEYNEYTHTEISKETWLLYIATIKYCMDNNEDFVKVINKLEVQSLLESVKFVNKPTESHYKAIKEALRNV